jgi:hypothetical protein
MTTGEQQEAKNGLKPLINLLNVFNRENMHKLLPLVDNA